MLLDTYELDSALQIRAKPSMMNPADRKDERPAKGHPQTHCPVMGGKIDSTVYTDIHGQRVYHCCPGCSESLKKDPDKFFKKPEE